MDPYLWLLVAAFALVVALCIVHEIVTRKPKQQIGVITLAESIGVEPGSEIMVGTERCRVLAVDETGNVLTIECVAHT